MLRRIADMPTGTFGFEAIGEVEDDDWEEGGGAGVARPADTGFRARYATSFERVAVVSDESWMRPAMKGLSFMLPGKARAFRVAELGAARDWLAAADSG